MCNLIISISIWIYILQKIQGINKSSTTKGKPPCSTVGQQQNTADSLSEEAKDIQIPWNTKKSLLQGTTKPMQR